MVQLSRYVAIVAFLAIPIAGQNDSCFDATDLGSLTGEITVSGNTDGYVKPDGVPFCSEYEDYQNILEDAYEDAGAAWYKVEVTCATLLTLSTCNQASFDTVIRVFGGTCDELQCIVAQDDSDECTDFTTILDLDIDSPATKTYYVVVGGFADSETGSFDLTLDMEPLQSGNCHGDPHFLRWGHDKRDSFQGECDLVFLHADTLKNGDSLDVHLRTTIFDSFSYVEAAAVRVGDDTFEFRQELFLFNGDKMSYDLLPLKFGSTAKPYELITSVDPASKKRETRVILDEAAYISIRSKKRYMSVSASGGASNFASSVGLLGEFGTGTMIGRSGQVISDYTDYGFEWQVNQNDPKLFSELREPQLPYERCRMPAPMTTLRRLRAVDQKLLDKATKACDGSNDFDLCVNDVMVTGDLELAEDFH